MKVAALTFTLLAAIAPSLPAQATDFMPQPAPSPPAEEQPPPEVENFTRWIAEGKRKQIPWEFGTYGPDLSMDQRMEIVIHLRLDEADLRRSGTRHELVLLARVAPEGGDWLPEIEWLEYPIPKPLASGTAMILIMRVLLTPGRYRMGVVLLDRVSGLRNVTIESVDVKPLKNDPLPALENGLPVAEFLTSEDPHQQPDRPHATERRLHIQNKRPLHIEVITAMTFTSRRFGFLGKEFTSRWVLEILDPLAALKPAQGTLRFTGIDLDRGKLAFDVDFTEYLEWDELHDAFSALAPEVVEFEALADRQKTEDFFRQFIEGRLRADTPTLPRTTISAALSGAADPLRILIILGQDLDRTWRKKVIPVKPPEDCRCRVYFFRLPSWGDWNDLGTILKPLKPQVFKHYGPLEFRRALAQILKELSDL